MDSDKFYEMAGEPGFPDEMNFQLAVSDTTPEDRTFSREGIGEVVDNMDAFIMARIFAYWKRTGKPARRMRFTISMDFEDPESVTNMDLPYYEGEDMGGLLQVDGQVRIPRNK